MIRTSLAAVPRRGTFLACKLAAAAALALVVAVVTSFVTFLLGQAMLGEEHRTSLSEPGVLRAVIGAALYMTLLVLFAAGVATLLRQPVLAMGVLVPFFFMISSILVAIPATKEVARYLPDQAGQQVMIVTAQENAPAYGPWGGLGIMALWTAVAVGVGYVALLKRDA
jgi:ABC-2 type transport system permease protein